MTMPPKTQYPLTQKFIEHLPLIIDGPPKIYFDDGVKGFGVCVGRQVKTYILQRQIKGKSVRVTLARTNELSVSKARAEASHLLLKMRNGYNPNLAKKPVIVPVAAAPYTLQKLLDQHLESLRLKGCHHSVERYPQALNLHVRDWLTLPVESITRDLVIERHRRIGVNIGKRSANSVFRTLRALYNLYRIDHPEFHNPVEILSLKKLWFKETPRDVRIKSHEIRRWIQALQAEVKNEVHRDYMMFLLLNGLRKNEAMSLSWDQVDFEGKSFRIEKTKNKKPLELPLTTMTEAILCRRLAVRDRDNVLTSPWVFPSDMSVTGHLYTVSKSLAQVNKTASMNIRLHDLRRTFVSIANSIKIPHYTIKKLVNHSAGGDVTASVYNVMDVDDLREPMQQISDEFRKLMPDFTPAITNLTLYSQQVEQERIA